MKPLLLALGILLTGGLGALLAGRRAKLATTIGSGSAILACLLGLAAAGPALGSGTSEHLSLFWQVPGGSFTLHIDRLSAFFLVPIFTLSLLCALYGNEYLKSTAATRRQGPPWFFFNLLVATMALVTTAANAVLFLTAWELMSLTSFFLVTFEQQHEYVRRAGWLYLLSTHLGTGLLFALFLLLSAWAGSPDFAAFGSLVDLSAGPAAVISLLALFGFGAKAGLFPLHVWLPDAHPAAPSHVSALMSGVMIKTGIYGILRICGFLPPAPAWWGGLLMGLGIAGALFGISMAAMQQDIKRCLAYSTVENVGLIFMALGLGWYAAARQLPEIALLALAGGLLHLWNHALFKGLMFLGAGSLLDGTGTRDLDQMGGLLRRMPATGTLLLGGSIAICALPPLNGFVSEWLIYRGLLQTGNASGGLQGLFPLLLVGLLALTGGLAVVVFTRLTGIALLGQPRQPKAALAHEAGWPMLLPMAVLFGLCLAFGLFPETPLRLILGVAGDCLHQSALPPQALPDSIGRLGTSLFAALAIILLIAFGLHRRLRRVDGKRPTWGCGYAFPGVRMAYTAEGYAELVQHQLLPQGLRPKETGAAPQAIFPAVETISQESADPVFQRLLAPFFSEIARRCNQLHWLQHGRLHIYLLYIFLTCFLLLAWSTLTEWGLPW
ncbi:proton-conducting transporter transmembrane domain-containing protein [Trichloromonas sp.]|uniref:proton-conducting transporter transmembrane domain-containing protein n=1 Tax=Trichloromonas sp. TaxID=3069249 RepID=UPI003D81B074